MSVLPRAELVHHAPDRKTTVERRLIAVTGVVQGVGFRPFVHRLATELELRGVVRNDVSGVTIDVEGERAALDAFRRALATRAPLPAAIAEMRETPAPPRAYSRFIIAESGQVKPAAGGASARVTPDIATCDACLAELADPGSRRYRYPFITCAQCGPRFTIVDDVPYDRPRTTMAAFTMCDDCRREYENPHDRRFHAQTNACPRCGPTLALRTVHEWDAPIAYGDAALAGAVDALRRGEVVAIKGLGGYHVACDAFDAHAVQRLRVRKRRDAKPLAVMMASVADAERYCAIDAADAALLAAPQRPIVLLVRRPPNDDRTARAMAELAPGTNTLGVMLPYTPLHHLLLADFGGPLVMTSGNRSDEPIATDDADARDRLDEMCDRFLTHDRPIATRCDDSVLRSITTRERADAATRRVLFVRRSRGYAPHPITLPAASPEPVVAVGGHQKNTFCLVRDDMAFLSPHIGDLAHPAAYDALRAGIARHMHLFRTQAAVVAHDLHPDYLSTRLAGELPVARRIAVQHHHAHIAACAAEHGVREPVIGVALDGAGLGTDGAVWGGEFLLVHGATFTRLGHLRYVPLPGGDAAAREPWRPAAAHLWSAFDGDLSRAPASWVDRQPATALNALRVMLAGGVAAPPSSSAGRLFDAVASLVGVRDRSHFEAQGAMELEAIADAATRRSYPVVLTDATAADGTHAWTLDCAPLVRAIAGDVAARRTAAEIAGAFHNAMRDMILAGVERARDETGITRVALSGGVFQNVLLTTRVTEALSAAGLTPLVHVTIPPNDGGLALGQAWVAACLLRDAGERVCA